MSDTLFRQFLMLRRIPRYPRRVTVQDLAAHLDDQGYTVSERTIQRDLLALSGRHFGLVLDDRVRPHGWSWDRDAVPIDIPGMSPQMALAFKLAEHYAGELMAPATLNTIAPYLRQAERVLAETDSPVRAWPEKVRTLTRGQRLLPPPIDQDLLETVYDGLFNDRQLDARYQRRYDGQTRDYRISPLGIVFRDGVVYLVCQRNGQDAIVHLALHRFLSAQTLDVAVARPPGFDLSHYVEWGGLDFKLSDTALRLELLVQPDTAVHLQETPLSHDQTLHPVDDGRQRLRATVADTAQIRWWILGLGDQVEVASPPALRQEIEERLQRALAQYRP